MNLFKKKICSLLKGFSGVQKFLQLNNIDEKCLEKAAENLEIRNVKKNEYFINEGEPTGFFAGVIKGKVSIRKTHIFDKLTNEIIIKPLYKVIMMKKPMLLRSSRRKSSNSLFLKSSKEKMSKNILDQTIKSINNNINNSINNNINNNINSNKVGRKESSKELNAINHIPKTPKTPKNTFKRMAKSIINNRNEQDEKNNKNFRIIKEIFDPKKYIVSEEELFRMGEGYCFGEWALIYNEPRSASIYTLEDCVFFTLDEIHFKNSFLKSLNNSEYSKKKICIKKFSSF